MATTKLVIKKKNGKAAVNENGETLIYVSYCHDSHVVLFTTQIKVDPAFWNEKKQVVNSTKNLKPLVSNKELIAARTKEDQLTNAALETLESKIKSIVRRLQTSDQVPTADLVKEEYLKSIGVMKKSSLDFVELFDEFIEESRSNISSVSNKTITEASINQYRSCLETLKDFQKDTTYRLHLSKMDKDFYGKFRKYMTIDKGLSPNTFGGKVKKIKTFLSWCQDRDLPVSNKFKGFEVPATYMDAEPLKPKELISFWNYKTKNLEDQKIIDILLALCSSGMRISDYNRVMTNMDQFIQETSEGKAIIFKAQKTGALCVVPFQDDLYFRPVSLYNKYSGKMPKIHGQTLNKALKELQKQEDFKFDRFDITSKTGRKTLVSVKLYEQQMNPEFIMKITGHKTRAEFDKYAGVDHSSVIKANREKSTHI